MKTSSLDRLVPIEVKNILYLTDLSFAAERALTYVRDLAIRYGATVYVVHAMERPTGVSALPQTIEAAETEAVAFRQERQEELDRKLADLHHDVMFERGDLVDILSKIIAAKKIDLLVMGAQNHVGPHSTLMGSRLETVLHDVSCPVLTVGPSVVSSPEDKFRLNSILYAVHFSAESLAAAPIVISLASAKQSRLIFLHCIGVDGNDVSELRRALADLVPFGVDLKWEPDCIVERGRPSDKILEVAGRHRVDLIALGIGGTQTTADGACKRLRPGILKIVMEAKSPVLTICAP